jgi:hypothetical protein
MKKIKYLLVACTVILVFGSCKKYLDVNTNPNSPTSSTAELVMPQALTAAASSLVGYNSYGAWQAGQSANAGGFGGYGSLLNYNYGPDDYTGLWSGPYNILEDFQYILDQTEGSDRYAYYNAAARIMKSYLFQLLVDQYNNVPYTEALKGVANTTPKYDDAKVIYKDLYTQLDKAITTINTAQFPAKFKNILGDADPLFHDDMTKWKQFANTLKLKLLIRASGTSVFTGVTPSFDAAGFLTTDAIVNPGYSKASGKQNPNWNTFHSSFDGASAGSGRSNITTHFALTFYNGNKISDIKRATAVYRGATAPARNQLGITDDNVPFAPSGGPVWFSGDGANFGFTDDPDGTSPAKSAVGILKGRNMGQPLMLAAESYLLQAEGRLKGIIATGATVQELFDNGITASFNYLYKNATNNLGPNPLNLTDPVADAAAYHTNNAANRLVNIQLATTTAQQLEAIITQKYIALNFIHGHESWAEFRRTGYPVINNTAPLNQNLTFVSVLSAATTVDKLPGRILYPNTERQLNPANVPSGVTTWGSFVFWDRRN